MSENLQRTHEAAKTILKVNLLGPLKICDQHGEEIDLPRKIRALFAYLLTRRGTTVPRTTLLGLFWGDRPQELARGSLRQALSILRAALDDAGERVLSTTNESVTLHDSGIECDLDLLETMSRQPDFMADCPLLSLQSFELYEGLTLADGAFEDWLSVERENVRLRVANLLKSSADAAEEQSVWSQAAALAAMRLRIDPGDEDAHRQLMRVHLAQGRKDSAIQQFEKCRTALREHLGIAPDADTVTLWRHAKSTSSDSRTSAKIRPEDLSSSELSPKPVYLLAIADDERAGIDWLETALQLHGAIRCHILDGCRVYQFTNASTAQQIALELRQHLRQKKGSDDLVAPIALHARELNTATTALPVDDVHCLRDILAQSAVGQIDASEPFFRAVRRLSNRFFEKLEEVSVGHAGQVYRVGRPMQRQPFLALYENERPVQEKRPVSLAVAPIEYLGRDQGDNTYLVDGLTEDLILDLSRTRRIQVSSRTTLMAIAEHDAVEIGKMLGVGFVLFGNLRQVGNGFRLNFSLAETELGDVIWSERYHSGFDNLFELLDEIIYKVVARTTGKIEQSEIAAARMMRPENMTAYDYYLHGLWHHRLGGVTSEHSRKAVKWFKKSIKADPNFHRPRAMLSCAWSDLPEYDEERADRSVAMAYEADPSDPEANRIMAWVKFTRGDYESGLRHAERSMELAPHDAYLVGRCAVLHIFCGDPLTGLERLERAVELDPFVPVYIVEERLTAHYAMGNHPRVLAEARRLNHQTRRSRYYTAASLIALEQREDARQIISAVLDEDPELSLDYVVGQELYRDKKILKLLLERLSEAGVPGDVEQAMPTHATTSVALPNQS